MDMEYDYYENYDEADGYMNADGEYSIPDVVREFLRYLRRSIVGGKQTEMAALYSKTFSALSEKYFKGQEWPSPDTVSREVGSEEVFVSLYKEIYYRHIYAKLEVSVEQRFASFDAYQSLFGTFLNVDSVDALAEGMQVLPVSWIWDMVDEYIYQYQSFCQYRSKVLRNKAGSLEAETIQANPDKWATSAVLATLYQLVEKSQVETVLALEREESDEYDGATGTTDVADVSELIFGSSEVYKLFGYFAIVGLVRVHVLHADYYLALKTLSPIDLHDKQAYYTLVTACHISLFYFIGFAYLMMGRYVDATNTWSNALGYITRTKQFHVRSYQYDQIIKMNEQMYTMLEATVTLCPQRLDEALHHTLREKRAERMGRMQRGDMAAFQEAFQRACPKFVDAAVEPPAPDAPLPYQTQLDVFLRDVEQQILVPRIRSYLKLYTSMSVAKLAEFLHIDEAEFQALLICYKHKTRNLVCGDAGQAPLSGVLTSSSDVEYYVDGGLVHIADTKVERRYGQYFLRHIRRFNEISGQ